MADDLSPTRIISDPGVKRDGTLLEGSNYVDAQWCRFQRGLPRKMGGYRVLNKYLDSIPRALHDFTQNQTTYIHTGSATKLGQFSIDSSGSASVVSDRTPAITASDDNTWQLDALFESGNTQIIAQVAPNLSDIANATGGELYSGDLMAATALTAITLPGGGSATGGICVLHPYLFYFGNDGYTGWSVAGAPSDLTSAGSGSANPASQKVIRGMPLRGGPGNSPSGIFWSLDALFRASFVGGSPIFSFDTLATGISVMSPNSIIEYNGVFYWLGVDNIFSFNGFVREVPNLMNFNWFFDNITTDHAQKVFAFKVPRFGEIWWCAPLFGATEPSHALIYNTRENLWYDTLLPNGGRSAGIFPSVYKKPLVSGVTEDSDGNYKMWAHEVGTDEVDGSSSQPIASYFETNEISLAEQGKDGAVRCLMVEPDFVQTGDMTLQIRGRRNARAPENDGEIYTFSDTATSENEQIVHAKEQRRLLRFKFGSNTVGGHYEMGHVFAHLGEGDGRTI